MKYIHIYILYIVNIYIYKDITKEHLRSLDSLCCTSSNEISIIISTTFKENTLKVYTYIYIYIYMNYELGRKKKKEFFLPWINKKKFEIIIRLIWPNLEEIFFHSKEVANFE